ncbi:MAG: hypothetical protein A3J10_00145 [Candidatus Sungbacteria bacterium RIFCSPLOWO2_02_FULL_54_10]|uniref:ECF transporter S component n=2 Tax=Candidatus Sungiibacteriota TaxID=1817917 RepID=A0A1G2L8Y3_9BACT|nr:MAG: hypothetical protein A2679_01045 [Candidatus Sungbacteria bacterium RIFCSPHIGHO2_01_FULL_54_26]OHA03981.1 MAG: hypothetical protein A3C92_02235 [Candidatus Sungbacteria bacterium RIFCSPHIGHO2_02_FULL_53_17]OHA08098.1 MAG: hypothetical protein A3B34_02265 [Candidatus Sungbacteria bacterium RIFCSPLOWO2_01_FULL_54_21]OHA12849.1 MAG: hypothetical protein A3J10_00145 [Candidatus Sungbacteria bacterium RIFCSPLOWO2_02_FULL_54_10]
MSISLRQNIFFIAAFALIGIVVMQVPFTRLAGSRVSFTLSDFFAPIATGFIGTVPGIAAVLLMQIGNFFLHGAEVVDAGTIIRFFPMLAAAYYFGRKDKLSLILPIIAIAAFIAHPIGRTVWYFAFYWLIPVAAWFFRDRFLLARALGATFSAHAVGGALWIWTFNLPAAVWIGLIPVVAVERFLFAGGIAATYIVAVNVLHFLQKRHIIPLPFTLNTKYLLNISRVRVSS